MSLSVISVIATFLAVTYAAPPPPQPPPSSSSSTSSFDLLMPNVQPQEPDTYLCNAIKIEEAHQYITGFDPKANSHDAHHMLLYGCEEPGKAPGEVWNCGEMSSSSSPSIPKAQVCQSGHNILYAWAMDAPKLNLPPDVGFDVGQATPVKYLVLQVHYKNVSKFIPPKNGHDSSGLVLHTTTTRTPKQAGVYLLATGGYLPAQSVEYFESACEYNEETEIVPFAFRTHAHSLGRVISGYRVRNGQWTELGRKDPRLPEMFYNVTVPGTRIKKGDILAARCTMENTKDHIVKIGNTQNDEMCNFYVMYYVDTPPTPSTRQCVTAGPPLWSWKDFGDQEKLNLKNLPPSASVIPGTTKPLEKTTGDYPDSPYDQLLDAATMGEEMAAEDIDPRSSIDNNELLQGVPGAFQEQTVEQLLDEAINEMNPDELLYLIQQLAREEEEEELRRKMWMHRQRMMGRNILFPN